MRLTKNQTRQKLTILFFLKIFCLSLNLYACKVVSESEISPEEEAIILEVSKEKSSEKFKQPSLSEQLLILLLPPIEELQAICHEIAGLNADARRKYGDAGSVNDINNDGTDEIIESCYGGTTHEPCVDIKLSNGELLPITTIGFEWKTFWTYGLKFFRKNGHIYSFHSYDDYFQKPAYLSYLTPENKEYVVCEFENKVIDEFVPNPEVPQSNELCNAVLDKDETKISYVKLTQKPKLSHKDLKKMGRYATSLLSQGLVDYDNDGIENYLGELDYASGAGRGCDFNYFDELTQDGLSFEETEARQLLLEMQGVGLSARHPSCGGMNNAFIQFDGKNFYELNTDKVRKISFIKDKRIIDACTVNRSITTTVKSYVKLSGADDN